MLTPSEYTRIVHYDTLARGATYGKTRITFRWKHRLPSELSGSVGRVAGKIAGLY